MLVSYEGEALKELKDDLAKKLFGRALSESLEKHICVRCGKPVRDEDFRDELSRKEYYLSGLCQRCQDEIWDGGLIDSDIGIQNYITVTRAGKAAIQISAPVLEEPVTTTPTWDLMGLLGLRDYSTFYDRLEQLKKSPRLLEDLIGEEIGDLEGYPELIGYFENVERAAKEKQDVYPISYFFERYFKPLDMHKVIVVLPESLPWSAGAAILSDLLYAYHDKIPLVVAELRNRGFKVYYNFDPSVNTPENSKDYIGVFLFEESINVRLWLGRIYPKEAIEQKLS